MEIINNCLVNTQENIFFRKELNELSDETLVNQYKIGNGKAFDVLLRRYQSKVFTYITYTIKSQEEAEDIFQDIFAKVIMCIQEGRYSETGKFSCWLMRLVHNHLVDYRRTSNNYMTISNDEYENDMLNNAQIAINENREKELIDIQTMKEIKQLIEMLPDNQREVILLRYFCDMSFKDIAASTNVSINTALGRMRYALMNMKKMARKIS